MTKAFPSNGTDAYVYFAWADGPKHNLADKKLATPLSQWLSKVQFKAQAEELVIGSLPDGVIVLVGLGKKKDFHSEILKKATAAAIRRIKKMGLYRIALEPKALAEAQNHTFEHLLQIMMTGLYQGDYDFFKYKSNKNTSPRPLTCVIRSDSSNAKTLAEAKIIGEAMQAVRDIGNLPGNEATPVAVAAYAKKMAQRCGLRYEAWDRKKLSQEKCGAFLAVSRGSAEEPRLIILRHNEKNAKAAPIVIIGKTITFDTGGVSLKPAKNMEWMKYDKSGGMAVLALMEIVARTHFKRPVIGILAAAENMPGHNATRPGDIVRSRAGKSIEIVNTDAEGRLVLADALSIARDLKPAAIIDLATLTGAAVTALGHITSAVMGNNRQLVRELCESGERCGERIWELPLYPEYRKIINTPFADMRNSGDGTAGAIIGGIFLKEFVDPSIPWAHIDLTNAWEEREQAFSAAGSNLFGAQLVYEWLKTKVALSEKAPYLLI